MLTFFHIDDVEIIEGICGFWNGGFDPVTETYERYYYYDPPYSDSFQVTIIYDGQQYSGSESEIEDILRNKTGVLLLCS